MWKIKHGLTNTSEFKAWSSMKERCLCKTNKAYKNYGERGISICKEWVDSFENFLKDMGKKPSREYSLDRINNNKSYTPENCRWATNTQQNRNKRTTTNISTNVRGVSCKNNRYEVRICANKKRISLGTYPNIEEAIEARKNGEYKYWS